MNFRYRWITPFFLLFIPIAVFASGPSDQGFQSVSVDLYLEDVTEEILFGDQDLLVFVLLVEGHAELSGVGEVFYSSYVTTQPSPPHKGCQEAEVGGIGMGCSTMSFPGWGILMLDIVSMEQCINPATGEFRVTQKERVAGGTGPLAEAEGEINLEVKGRIGSDQTIHIRGELKLPES